MVKTLATCCTMTLCTPQITSTVRSHRSGSHNPHPKTDVNYYIYMHRGKARRGGCDMDMYMDIGTVQGEKSSISTS